MSRIERLEVPTVTVLHGDVSGIGLQIALVTDLRVATTGTSVGIDLLYGDALPGAALARLPKYIGLGRARQMLLLGQTLSIEDAAISGLIDIAVEDPETAWPPVLERLLGMPPLAVSMVRKILKDSFMADMEEARATFRAALFQIATDSTQ
jgi:enoyl-CoA hydratase/carnithine racemase